jgi:hypothetical protein
LRRSSQRLPLRLRGPRLVFGRTLRRLVASISSCAATKFERREGWRVHAAAALMKFLLCISNAFTLTPWHKTRLKFRSVNASWDILQCSPTRRSAWVRFDITRGHLWTFSRLVPALWGSGKDAPASNTQLLTMSLPVTLSGD